MDQNDWKFQLEQVFRSDADELLDAHKKGRMMHGGHDIRAAGDEVEIAFRKMLDRKLPSSFYVGHGHIVDAQLHQSPQLDAIIANNTGVPILFQANNGSAYFPYEGIYAIGEVKSSYDSSRHHIQAFSDVLRSIQVQLQREPFRAVATRRPDYESILHPLLVGPYGNPLFSFMFFADQGDFDIEQIRNLYQTRPESELPNIICILNRGLILNTRSHVWKNRQQKWEPARQGHPESISLIPASNELHRKYYNAKFSWVLIEHGENEKSLAANLANFYYPLIQHLQRCQLTVPNLAEYVNHLFDTPTTTVIV